MSNGFSAMLGKQQKDKRAEAALAEQQRIESQRKAEEESDISERKSRSRKKMGGLIKTSEAGVQASGSGKQQLSGIV